MGSRSNRSTAPARCASAARSTLCPSPRQSRAAASAPLRRPMQPRARHTGGDSASTSSCACAMRPAALGRDDQALERSPTPCPLLAPTAYSTASTRGRLRAASRARVRDEAGAVVRQARRPIADEQSFAEPRRRFDVVLAHAGREMVDRVAVRPAASLCSARSDFGESG